MFACRFSILSAFAIYLLAGREIFQKRHQLREFQNDHDGMESSLSNYKTTKVEITSSEVEYPCQLENTPGVVMLGMRTSDTVSATRSSIGRRETLDGKGSNPYERYTVNIASSPVGPPRPSHLSVGGGVGGPVAAQLRRNRANLEANRAAWGYTKVALLFFVSLLVTWVSTRSSFFPYLPCRGESHMRVGIPRGAIGNHGGCGRKALMHTARI